MPCVCNATLLGGWHVELQTLLVLGGRASVECISSVRCPAGADSRVVVDNSFCTNWHNWNFVEVIRAMDFLIVSLLGSRCEKWRMLRVSLTWSRNSSHSCRGQFLSTAASPAMKRSLNVVIAHLAALTWWLWGGTRGMSILLYLMYVSTIFEHSLSIRFMVGL